MTAVNGLSDADYRLNTVQEALEALKQGEFLLVVDDLDRENEGDLVMAASHVTTEKMAWMIKHTRLVSATVSAQSLES